MEPRNWIEQSSATLRTWNRRARTRRHLLTLNDHLLADIGLSRTDAIREASRPFWQA
ncbi:MAG: DUF1127 domain-containing protein [Thiotrichales bacterium]|nr:DUF1127 domain-containing protein [Thiotrichales bacterium]